MSELKIERLCQVCGDFLDLSEFEIKDVPVCKWCDVTIRDKEEE